MNKMCYIEICTDKMDMPKLTEELAACLKAAKAAQEIKVEKKDELQEKKENSAMTFETVVHKGIIEDEE